MSQRAQNHERLRRRASAFLARQIPAELRSTYVPGSLSEIVITKLAADEALEAELLEIAGIAVQEYDGAIAEAKSAELRSYYGECQSILRSAIEMIPPS